MAFDKYSVLMSVYEKSDPSFLRVALDSMLSQSVAPDEIVVVKDGRLTEELEEVLHKYESSNRGLFRYVSYDENRGLGFALSQGILACSNELVARMDADDYAYPNRCERQLGEFANDDSLDLLGSQVTEFVSTPENPVSTSELPLDPGSIRSFSKRRNPFRHPSMMLRRSKVLKAGNYSSEYLFFEDWDLFNRMLADGCVGRNLDDVLVAMRVSEDFYGRRGGRAYLPHIRKFKREQLRRGYFGVADYVASYVPHAIVCLMPNGLRSLVYTNLLRRKTGNSAS